MPQDDVVALFMELAAVPSPPGDERAVADLVAAYMRDLGLDVSEDDAGERIGSNAGNLYARIEPTDGGTLVTLRAEAEVPGPAVLVKHAVKRGVDANLATLKAILEGR